MRKFNLVLSGIIFLLLTACSAGNGGGTAVGEQAPDFTITSSDGQTISLSDFRGRVLLITSAATWCNTCIIEAENLRPVYEEFRNRGVEFLTVSIDPKEDKNILEQFRSRAQTSWFYATKIGASEIVSAYKFNRFEITYVIDQEGIIRYVDRHITTADELRPVLSSLVPRL